MPKAFMTISEEYETIKCVECGMEFLLFAVLRGEDEHTLEKIVKIMHQVSNPNHKVFCPYCGKKT